MDEIFTGETIEEYIRHELNRMYLMEFSFEWHLFLWGVPCGPTLEMVEGFTGAL